MQLLMVFIIWLILRVIQFIPFCARRLSRKEQRMPQFLERLNLSGHASIVKSILVDFQESQCYFVLSVQAAAIVALTGDAGVLGATSLQQLGRNFETVSQLSSGYIPTLTFGLWMLRRSLLDSAYIFAWSFASIVVSAYNLFGKIGRNPKTTGINPISNLDDLDKCGHNPPPLVYCCSDFYGMYTSSQIISAGCLSIFGVLMVQKIISYLEQHLNCYPAVSRLQDTMKPVLASKAIRMFSKVWALLVETFLLINNLLYIVSNSSTPEGDWSFGQIIAVTIWVPVITKYIYWSFFGTKSYSATRLSEPFHIVEVEPKRDPLAELEENQTYTFQPLDSTIGSRPTPTRTFTWS
ncbi:hypothetical protein N7457_006881 [Penicillium paradoxum]|uniref:uncharacterized protein n=1 Tax=Penicillium paradoxum TaxID=176176 RepID=UPI002548B079|nr:uncharacterized protein N7457_006881 [Penicillium paradoxum]KAJ5779161.1 hypothetical protein N7457_006881 [Penicillium paradoxum]